MQLKDKYTSFSREQNQSLSSFALKYQSLERKLTRYNAAHCIPIGQERSIKFIMACNLADKSRQIQLVSDILDGKAASSWTEDGVTYEEMAEKLADLEKTSKFLKLKMGIKTKQTTLPLLKKGDRPAALGSKSDQGKLSTDALRSAFRKEIKENPSVDMINKWKGKHKFCVFHLELLTQGGQRKPHHFLYCNKVKDICMQTKCLSAFLEEARRSNNRTKGSKKSSSSDKSASSSISKLEMRSILDTQAKMATMMETLLAAQGTSDASQPPKEIGQADEGTATSEHTIGEVSFAEGTADATISIISNNSQINHYTVVDIPSCMQSWAPTINKTVTFHPDIVFNQPISSSPPTFIPHYMVWPYARSDIESIDTTDQDTDPVDDSDEMHHALPGDSDEYVYARSTHLPSTFTDLQNTTTPPKDKHLRTINDTGTTHNMNPHREMFDTIHPLHDKYGRSAQVILGDGTTTRPVLGWGYSKYMLNGIPVWKKEPYVPSIGTHLTSVTQHCQYQGCYFHAENGGTAILAFPDNVLQIDCKDELTLELSPIPDTANVLYLIRKRLQNISTLRTRLLLLNWQIVQCVTL